MLAKYNVEPLGAFLGDVMSPADVAHLLDEVMMEYATKKMLDGESGNEQKVVNKLWCLRDIRDLFMGLQEM
ncbi:hypothetical protein EBZ39_03545 [bacterium]|nr:hypothetical protein [bacterium]